MGCVGSKGGGGDAGGDVTLVRAGGDGAADTPRTANDKSITELFNRWDVADGANDQKIEVEAFRGGSVKVGPHESRVLELLAQMDFDGDGYVTYDEWHQFFATAAGSLSPEEFGDVMKDLADAADNMVTIARCSRIVTELGAPAAAADDDDDDDDDDNGEVATPPLSAARLAAVQAIFKAWDYEGAGSIDRTKLQNCNMTVGPHESKVLSSLADMDLDGDNLVTEEEMLFFFTGVSPSLSDTEFDEIRDEMLEVAGKASSIIALTEMASSAPATRELPGGDEEEEEEEDAVADPPPPTMSAERTAQLRAIFDIFLTADQSTKADAIDMATLESDCTTKIGPHEANLFKELRVMDANGDGQLTFEEMCGYFTVVGAELSDAEFEDITSDLKGRAEVASISRMAVEG